MSKALKRFLIVDDDPQNNLLSKLALKKSFGEVQINDFVIPEIGLEFIESEFTNIQPQEKITLFLDINMPTMTGWEFLEKFGQFKKSLKEQFSIYILSSSVDPTDINRAKANPHVIDFIEKPLSMATLLKMFA
ncbi:MAG: response regulator [Bacteroidota bacterium]|nr:response regulator [Bacteroidota bacterium]